MAGEIPEEARNIFSRVALSLPPSHVVCYLLSSGVCVRCIFRLFGVHGDAYSCQFITGQGLHYFLNVENDCQGGTLENGISSFGLTQCSYTLLESDDDQNYCTICLGILQFHHNLYLEGRTSKENSSIDAFVEKIVEPIKRENYQIDGFLLEVSIPPVTVANERAFWLNIEKKYDSEAWLKDMVFGEKISLKDALKLSITASLEKQLRVKSGANSFHIRLTYTHLEASLSLQKALGVHSTNKRTEKEKLENFVDHFSGSGQLDFNVQLCSKSDATTLKALNSLDDHIFCERFKLPTKMASKSYQLTSTCYREPMFIGGRYLKVLL